MTIPSFITTDLAYQVAHYPVHPCGSRWSLYIQENPSIVKTTSNAVLWLC